MPLPAIIRWNNRKRAYTIEPLQGAGKGRRTNCSRRVTALLVTFGVDRDGTPHARGMIPGLGKPCYHSEEFEGITRVFEGMEEAQMRVREVEGAMFIVTNDFTPLIKVIGDAS